MGGCGLTSSRSGKEKERKAAIGGGGESGAFQSLWSRSSPASVFAREEMVRCMQTD